MLKFKLHTSYSAYLEPQHLRLSLSSAWHGTPTVSITLPCRQAGTMSWPNIKEIEGCKDQYSHVVKLNARLHIHEFL